MGLAVSSDGSQLASAGKDRTLRVWCRTDEPVFIEEERERELEAMVSSADLGRGFESATALAGSGIAPDMDGGGGAGGGSDGRRGGDDMDDDFEGSGGGGVGDGGGAEAARATKQSEASLKAGERLMEALEAADHEDKAIAEWEADQRKALLAAARAAGGKGGNNSNNNLLRPRPPNPMLLELSPDRYVLRTLRMIKRPDLEEALLVLPFHLVERLVERLASLLEGGVAAAAAAAANAANANVSDDDDDEEDEAAMANIATTRKKKKEKKSPKKSRRAKGTGGALGFSRGGGACVDAELCTRCAVFLVRLHHGALAASGGRVQRLLRRLRDGARARATEARDLVGGNLAALRLLKRSLDADRAGAVVRVDDDDHNAAAAAAAPSSAALTMTTKKKRNKAAGGKK